MIRQSISLTEPNDAWLRSLVENQEYTSKSEIVNDLIRRARACEQQTDFIRHKLIAAEKSGFGDATAEQIRAAALATMSDSDSAPL
jgi:antitoxin ParD1/3/4